MTAVQLRKFYGVEVYRNWKDVPQNLHTKTSAKKCGAKIPDMAKPDAIKNAASVMNKNAHYLLYDINKYKTLNP